MRVCLQEAVGTVINTGHTALLLCKMGTFMVLAHYFKLTLTSISIPKELSAVITALEEGDVGG